MKDLILALVQFYENTIFTVEKMIFVNQEQNHEEQEKIKMCLREILAKNCYLRKKDFDGLMSKILSDIEKKEGEIKKQKNQLTDKIYVYLSEQKQWANSLRERLAKLNYDNSGVGGIEKLLERVKDSDQKKVRKILGELENLEQRYEAYQRDQEEINKCLQKLIEKGETLRFEDLRKLINLRDTNKRTILKKKRRKEVKEMLFSFRQQRLKSHRRKQD